MMFLGSAGTAASRMTGAATAGRAQPWDGNEMDTYADDLAALIEALDLKDAVHVGHSTGGGEVARYIGRHGTKRVAKAVLIGAVPPLMLKTDSNPGGMPMEAFDEIRAERPERPFAVLQGPQRPFLRRQPARSKGFAGSAGFLLAAGDAGGFQGGRTTASRHFRKPTSPRTSRNSTCRR